jgi:hypothetical protein
VTNARAELGAAALTTVVGGEEGCEWALASSVEEEELGAAVATKVAGGDILIFAIAVVDGTGLFSPECWEEGAEVAPLFVRWGRGAR